MWQTHRVTAPSLHSRIRNEQLAEASLLQLPKELLHLMILGPEAVWPPLSARSWLENLFLLSSLLHAPRAGLHAGLQAGKLHRITGQKPAKGSSAELHAQGYLTC